MSTHHHPAAHRTPLADPGAGFFWRGRFGKWTQAGISVNLGEEGGLKLVGPPGHFGK